MQTKSQSPSLALPLIIVAGCIIAMTSFGVRSTFGLFTLPVTAEFGWGREVYGLALAIQNLMWGVMQPIAGGMADRYGTAKTLSVGALIYAAGLLMMATGGSEMSLYLGGGVLAGVGIGTASFAVVMAAFGRAVPAEKRSFVFGIATAASSAGQFVFAPIGQQFINAFGWQTTLIYFAAMLMLILPLSFALKGQNRALSRRQRRPSSGGNRQARFPAPFIQFVGCRVLRVWVPPCLCDRAHARLFGAMRTFTRRRQLGTCANRLIQHRRFVGRRLFGRQGAKTVPFGLHLFVARCGDRSLLADSRQRSFCLSVCGIHRSIVARNSPTNRCFGFRLLRAEIHGHALWYRIFVPPSRLIPRCLDGRRSV